uniref:Uncharacterized protein n=1 Tax=Anguilla anguilla TaxID=7936 RepID=A0A0E9PSU8_ANGAN
MCICNPLTRNGKTGTISFIKMNISLFFRNAFFFQSMEEAYKEKVFFFFLLVCLAQTLLTCLTSIFLPNRKKKTCRRQMYADARRTTTAGVWQ